MPWTPKQMRAIRAREHGWNPPPGAPFADVSQAKAHEMAGEGLRPAKRTGKKTKRSKITARDAAMALKGRG